MKSIVIVRWNEPIDWTREIEYPIHVVQKGTKEIPNIGLEHYGYIYWIQNNYDELEGDYTFLQANPFDHISKDDLDKHLKTDISTNGFLPCSKWITRKLNRNSFIKFDLPYGSDSRGYQTILAYETIFNMRFPDKSVWFPNGQFSITAERLKRRDKFFYVKLLADMKELEGHFMERYITWRKQVGKKVEDSTYYYTASVGHAMERIEGYIFAPDIAFEIH